jgi:ABC-type phosphate/phosphonate transport system substrate-binding protein
MKKMRYVATLAIAATALTVGLAPVAAADVSVAQTPGNAQISASPGVASQEAAQAQMPFGGDSTALLFHHR